MDFSKQLANLARAANSNSRENTNGNNNTNNSTNQPPPRRHNDYNSRDRGRHSYHPYNNRNRRGGGRHYNNNNYHNRGQLTQAELEFYLPKLIEAIPKYHPITTSRKKSKRRHVALLFLTIDDLPFEHVWRAFLKNYKLDITEGGKVNTRGDMNNELKTEGEVQNKGNTSSAENEVDEHKKETSSQTSTQIESTQNKIDPSLSNSNLLVSVLCHAKFPERVKSPWLQRRLLVSKAPNNRHNNNNRRHSNNNSRYDNRRHDDDRNQHVRYHTRRPEWGSVDITRAMIDLLDEGLKIGKSKSNCDNDERYSYARYMANDDNDTTFNQDFNNQSSNSSANPSSMYSPSRKNQNQNNESLPEVDRFIFVSESCLPIVTLQEMEMALFGPEETTTLNNIRDYISSPKRQRPNQDKEAENASTAKQCHEHYSGVHANKSWLNAYNKPNNGYARLLQWDATNKAVPKNCIYKADQWIVLTRKHAWPLISLIDDAVKSVQQAYSRNQSREGGHHNSSYQSHSNNIKVSLWQCFEHVKASDEIYFPTAMALLGILNTATDDDGGENGDGASRDKEPRALKEANVSFEGEIAFKRVTYCDWSEKGKNPKSFIINKQKDSKYVELKNRILTAREEGCLIGRKFITGGNLFRSEEDTINVKDWIKIIQDAVLK